MSTSTKVIYWIARILAAFILLQTLFFKFTGARESIEIFRKVGMEPWGRYGTGIFELIASILLLINPTAWAGASLALGLMAGAIFMHLTILGIEVQGDGGQLFIYACLVALSSVFVLFVNKARIIEIVRSRKKEEKF
jgi:uncharacterized membrane protein YphA (DoxX/SURF4 family)